MVLGIEHMHVKKMVSQTVLLCTSVERHLSRGYRPSELTAKGSRHVRCGSGLFPDKERVEKT